ncbi:MAG: hypothetical protein NVSMB6_08740 [Burkholderiaceae bacterium]
MLNPNQKALYRTDHTALVVAPQAWVKVGRAFRKQYRRASAISISMSFRLAGFDM